MGNKVHQAREWLAFCIPSSFWDKYGTRLLGDDSFNPQVQKSTEGIGLKVKIDRTVFLAWILGYLPVSVLPPGGKETYRFSFSASFAVFPYLPNVYTPKCPGSILVFFSTFSLPVILSPMALNITSRLTSPEFWSPAQLQIWITNCLLDLHLDV